MLSISEILANENAAKKSFSEEFANDVLSVIKEFKKGTAFTFQSSGSTGKPKVFSFTKQEVFASCMQTQNFFKISTQHQVLTTLHPKYVAGKMMLLRALFLNWKLDICEPKQLLEVLKKKQYDFTPLVPLQLEQVLNETSILLPFKILLGGTSVSEKLSTKLKALKASSSIYHGYGMTETLTHVAMRSLYPNLENHYKALPNVAVNSNQNSCLNLEISYLKQAKIATTDLVEFEANLGFKILGRKDWIINSGGHKINPLEIEPMLADLIATPFFITGEKDDKLGEKAVLFIESIHTTTTLQEVKTHLQKKTHKFNFPKKVICISEFARSASGKILRKHTANSVMN